MAVEDIVIIGGGPAGGMAASLACSNGFNVVLVEKRQRGAYRPSSGVFPRHALVDPEGAALPDACFERDLVTTRFLSTTGEGMLDASEFGTTLGKVIFHPVFDKHVIDTAEKSGATVIEGTTVTGINIMKDKVSVSLKNDSGTRIIDGDVLLLCCGSQDPRLHERAGIEPPRCLDAVIAEYESSTEHVESVLSRGAYHFYMNKSITKEDHFWITCRESTFNTGIIGKGATPELLASVIKNDPRVKGLFDGAREKVWPGRETHVSRAKVACFPVKVPYNDRVLALGDAAGLAHRFYFEGVWQARLSARLAVETLISIRESGSDPVKENLAPYKAALARKLVNKFNKSGRKNNWLFREAESGERLFDHFCNTIRNNREFRELIVSCYERDYEKEADKIDTRAGEMIFAGIPLLQKVSCAPLFLKAASIR